MTDIRNARHPCHGPATKRKPMWTIKAERMPAENKGHRRIRHQGHRNPASLHFHPRPHRHQLWIATSGIIRSWIKRHPDFRPPPQGLEQAGNFNGTVDGQSVGNSRGEINDLPGRLPIIKHGAKHICIRQVLLPPRRLPGLRLKAKPPSIFSIENATEQGGRIEPRQTKPLDGRGGRDESEHPPIPNDAVVQRRRRITRSIHGRMIDSSTLMLPANPCLDQTIIPSLSSRESRLPAACPLKKARIKLSLCDIAAHRQNARLL